MVNIWLIVGCLVVVVRVLVDGVLFRFLYVVGLFFGVVGCVKTLGGGDVVVVVVL